MPLYVKGEGGANVVLAWRDGGEEEERASPSSSSSSDSGRKRRRRAGEDRNDDDNDRLRRLLAGRVLRVRKQKKTKKKGRRRQSDGDGGAEEDAAAAAAASAAAAPLVDALIWAPLAGASATPAERDEAFAHRVLAPALGPLLQRGRRLRGDDDDEDDALLLRAALAAVGGGSGRAATTMTLPPELLPDATAALTPEELEQAADEEGLGTATVTLVAVGPALCFELKPKAGVRAVTAGAAVGAAGGAGDEERAASSSAASTAADDVRRRFSRFALHALLKQKEQKQEQQANGSDDGTTAAAATEQQQEDGPPLYDPWRLFDAASSASPDIAAAALEVAALLERPSNNLRVFRAGALVFGKRPAPWSGEGSGGGSGETNCCSQQALSGALIEPGPELERAAEQAVAKEGGAAAAAGASSSPPDDGDSPPPPPPPRPLIAALVAAALLGSGALPALLRLQETDEIGPEAAARLHASLLARVGGGGGQGAASLASSPPSVSPHLSPPRLPAHDLALMRAYGTAVTAKDASVMVTLQQVAVPAVAVAGGAGASASGLLWPWGLLGGSGGVVAAESAPVVAAAARRTRPPRAVGLLLDPREPRGGGGGAGGPDCRHHRRWLSAFAWRARVVDTDLKPAAKAHAHADLERRCLEFALGGEGDEGEGGEAAEASAGERREGDPLSLPPRLRRYAAEREAWRARWEQEWRAWVEGEEVGATR